MWRQYDGLECKTCDFYGFNGTERFTCIESGIPHRRRLFSKKRFSGIHLAVTLPVLLFDLRDKAARFAISPTFS